MTARKTTTRKPAASKSPSKNLEVSPPVTEVSDAAAPSENLEISPPVTEVPKSSAPPAETAPADEAELAWCRVGRDLLPDSPECPRHEFEKDARLCNLHFVTRLDLREVARNDG